MSSVMLMEPTRKDQALAEAVGRGIPVTLSLKQSGAWAVYKSRFLDGERRHDRVLIEYPHDPTLNPPSPDIRPGENVGIAFRRGHKKCVFTAVALGVCRRPSGEGPDVLALELGWPDSVQEIQRRAYYRACVPPDRTVPVELWSGGAACRAKAGNANRPIYRGRLTNLSAGGMGMVLPPGPDPSLRVNDAVGVAFQPEAGGTSFLLDATIRCLGQGPNGSLTIGLQFTGLEATDEGRCLLRQLVRVVNVYQRQELKHGRARGGED